MQTMQRPPAAKKKREGDLAKLLSTRGGLIAVATFAALLAGSLLIVFLQHYKKSITDEGTRTVLVAKAVIPKGSAGDVVASQSLYQVSKAQGNQVKAGALTDPSQLRGKVSGETIYPGQQLTSDEFAASTGAVNTKISGGERAVSVPMDTAHGMIGDVHAGDHVDIYSSFVGQTSTGRSGDILIVLYRNALVLRAPDSAKGGNGSNSTQNVVLQVPDTVAPKLAYTVDGGKVWIAERPQAGAKDSSIQPTTLTNLLAGVKPIAGGR